jgi:small subunit ribosomal protein S6e
VIGDPKTKKTYQKEVAGHHANSLLGRKIGDEIDGIFLGLPGYRLKITGGSDQDGFCMRPEIPGTGRKQIIATYGKGFHPKKKGLRKKVTFCGNTVSPSIVQLNMKVVGYGPRPIDEMMAASGEKEEEKKETKEKKK